MTPTTTALPYSFSIAGKHLAEYRTRATVNNGAAIFSPVVSDARCAPAEVVPEAPSALLIPLTLAATAGAGRGRATAADGDARRLLGLTSLRPPFLREAPAPR